MKTKLHLVKSKLLLLCFTLLSIFSFAQTALFTFEFNNNLNPNAGAVANPTLLYYKPGPPPVSITPNYNGGQLELISSDEGNFVEVTFNTTKLIATDPVGGYNNLIVSWKGQYSGAIFGEGQWTLQKFDGVNWSDVTDGVME